MSMCGICWFDGRALTDEIDDLRQRVKEAEAKAEVANKKGHEAVILAMKHEAAYKHAHAEVFRLTDLLNKANPNWGKPMQLNKETS